MFIDILHKNTGIGVSVCDDLTCYGLVKIYPMIGGRTKFSQGFEIDIESVAPLVDALSSILAQHEGKKQGEAGRPPIPLDTDS